MWKDPLNITYAFLLITIIVIRKIQTSGVGKPKLNKPSAFEILILACTGLSMLAPLLYFFIDFPRFSDYHSPEWFRWLGVPFFTAAIWLLWQSHQDLGKNWTLTTMIGKEHLLVTTGVYGYIRHPMYAAHFLWALAQSMMIPNWIIGPSLFLFTWILYKYRVSTEEAALEDRYGERYVQYQSSTGKLFPKKFKPFSG